LKKLWVEEILASGLWIEEEEVVVHEFARKERMAQLNGGCFVCLFRYFSVFHRTVNKKV
jgi:hypothetical protein